MRKYLLIAAAIFIVLLIVLSAPRTMGKSKFTINSVVDGNTVQLDNGYQIVLLGVAGSEASQTYLQDYKGKNVRIVMDGSSPRLSGAKCKDKRIYAYVKMGSTCLNSVILKEQKSDFCMMPNLVDSLDSYLAYAGREHVVIPEPVVVPDDTVSPDRRDRNREGDRSVTPHRGTRINGWSTNCSANCSMLEDVVDFKNPSTRNFAVNLASVSPGNYNFGQVCAIFDHLYNNWKYVNDPKGSEYVARASESITDAHLSGDCDDFAVTMCACIIAIGGNARINTAYNAVSGHAFTEVDVSGLSESAMRTAINKMFRQYSIGRLHTRVENGRTWLNLDWQASYPGGPYFQFNQCTIYQRNFGTTWTCQ